jgi:dienelactone hydrolase
MRRGFGETGGDFAEAPGPCSNRDYVQANRRAASDVLGAVDALRKEAWVDATRIVLLGHSAGGMSVLAAASSHPSGVVAVVSFAGGRGSDAPDHVCQPERLVDAWRALGAGATIPSLWVYAANDHFFGPALVREMFGAYRAQGAPAELVSAPPFAADGHALFSAGATELWWPAVASFFAENHLPVDIVWPRAAVEIAPPDTMGEAGKKAFAAYLASEGVEKAFAVGQGGYGWSTGRRTRDAAVQKALANCAEHAPSACSIYAIGDARVP